MIALADLLKKSENKIQTLNPILAVAARRTIEESHKIGILVQITHGERTKAEQDALYAKGRKLVNGKWTVVNKSLVVTNVQGGYSYHNHKLAFDICLLSNDGKVALWDTVRDGNLDGKRDWFQVADIAKRQGCEWGGDWDTFIDYPHFQMTFGLTIKQLLAGAKPPQLVPPTPPRPKYAQIYVKGTKIAEGQLIDGYNWIPVRVVIRALGEEDELGWYANQVVVHGKPLETKNLNGTGYVQMRDFVDALPGASFKYENATNRIDITV